MFFEWIVYFCGFKSPAVVRFFSVEMNLTASVIVSRSVSSKLRMEKND